MRTVVRTVMRTVGPAWSNPRSNRNVARIDERLKHLFDVSWILSVGSVRNCTRVRSNGCSNREHIMSWTTASATASSDVPGQGRATGKPGLRLTRRGRAVLLLTFVTLLLAAFSLGRVGTEAAPAGAKAPAPLAQTVVQQGETLWSVAQRVAPGHDPRQVIDRIADLNDLEDDGVRAGQLLLLPR